MRPGSPLFRGAHALSYAALLCVCVFLVICVDVLISSGQIV